MTIIRY